MNPHVLNEELDQQIERMVTRTNAQLAGSSSLLAIASELCHLPDPDFKRGLQADLLDEAVPLDSSSDRSSMNHSRIAAFSGIMPTLTGKGLRVFPADHRSFLVSFASHAALVLLIASGIWVGQRPIFRTTEILSSKLTYLGSGGGGGGDHSLIPVTKGTPPKFSDRQIAPPVIVVRNPNPALPVDSTVLGAPQVKLPQPNQIGDLMSSNVILPSNGTGGGGGAGSDSGTGLGSGRGAGVGSGADVGYGRGISSAGRGVTAPRAIYDPEPEYSEEARRVHFQGVVVLSIVIDQAGHARDIRVARSVGLGLDEKAIEAVKKWKFEPAVKDGHPVAVGVNVEVNFRLY